MNEKKLLNRIALITGGSSGIGFATARRFAQEGARVVIVARGEEREKKAEQELQNEGLDVRFIPCDVSSRKSVEELKKTIMAEYGHVDILFNNAGTMITASLENITDDDWDKTYNNNLKSVLYMCQNFMDTLKESHGVIVNNTSINALQHYNKGTKSYMYSTAKAALLQLSQSLARNYAPEVRVNCICPGKVVTNIFTNRDFSRFDGCNLMNRMADPAEIANVVLFLASDDSSFMTGSVVVADGGETLM